MPTCTPARRSALPGDPWPELAGLLGGAEDALPQCKALASENQTSQILPAEKASSEIWVRATADRWITDFLATELAKSKLVKLARATASERHLVVLIHPDTEAGLGMAVSDELPSVVPPAPLTHLWLIAPADSPRALRWACSSRWTQLVMG